MARNNILPLRPSEQPDERFNEFIQFEHNDKHINVRPVDVLYAHSNDHYIKVLISSHSEHLWVHKHCSLHELMKLLHNKKIMLLNRFCFVNTEAITQIDEMKVDSKHKRLVLVFEGRTEVLIEHEVDSIVKQNLLNT